MENDVRTSESFLKEIRKRIALVEEHFKKANRYQTDIAEYLEQLWQRGVKYDMNEPPQSPDKAKLNKQMNDVVGREQGIVKTPQKPEETKEIHGQEGGTESHEGRTNTTAEESGVLGKTPSDAQR